MTINIPLKRTILAFNFVLFSAIFIITQQPVYAQSSNTIYPQDYIVIEKAPPVEKYGHPAINPDGTYYIGDPIAYTYQLVAIPPSLRGDSPVVTARVFSSGFVVYQQSPGYILVNSTIGTDYGEHEIRVVVTVRSQKTGIEVMSLTEYFTERVVPYRPDFDAFPYTVITDGGHYSYQDRTAVAIHYKGSTGNDLADETLYPDRRLLLRDGNHTSVAAGTGFIFKDMPFVNDKDAPQIPVGIQKMQDENILNIYRPGSIQEPVIYMERAGYDKLFYVTTFKQEYKPDDYSSMNMTLTYEWNATDFRKDIPFSFPDIKQALSNTMTIDVQQPEQTVNVSIIQNPRATESGLLYETLRQYSYKKVMHEFNDAELARMVSADFPEGYIATGTPDYSEDGYQQFENVGKDGITITGRHTFTIVKYNILVPDDIVDTSNYVADYEWGELAGDTQDSMIVKIKPVSGGGQETITKEYQLYNFFGDYDLTIDRRTDAPLSVHWIGSSNNLEVKAEWAISGIDTDNGIIVTSCAAERCVLTVTDRSMAEGKTITAYNEFGGSATGQIPAPVDSNNPLSQDVIDRFYISITVVVVIIVILIVGKRGLSYLSRQ